MITEIYDIITDSPTKRIYEAVKQIPRGKVATYGQIAALAGEPKMARAVGNALHKNTDPEHIPCYRVVNSKGELAAEFVFRRRRETGGYAGGRRHCAGKRPRQFKEVRHQRGRDAGTAGAGAKLKNRMHKTAERPERQRKMSVSVFHYVLAYKIENTIISH